MFCREIRSWGCSIVFGVYDSFDLEEGVCDFEDIEGYEGNGELDKELVVLYVFVLFVVVWGVWGCYGWFVWGVGVCGMIYG